MLPGLRMVPRGHLLHANITGQLSVTERVFTSTYRPLAPMFYVLYNAPNKQKTNLQLDVKVTFIWSLGSSVSNIN